ncbi:hypothetical protein [Schaalia hyovaginalis]|uniref:Uncharacterized protein n=1 Tax=Schaalia hyovaginalis TaxID=29316 RepID=A0A923IXM0_9ACTO|nr:hypothetical protein [Schaalia hyovaginalis]MBB6333837.1 hypothetical protein [Schaalia hyovaginalis]MBB6335197.1 hypothetical protein [Schaalia hyovaginalis]
MSVIHRPAPGARIVATIEGHDLTITGPTAHTLDEWEQAGPALHIPSIVVRDLEDAERLATALKEYTRDRKRWTAHHGTRQPIE